MTAPEIADGALVGGRCASCHRRHFPPADWCPWCGGEDVATVALSTTGTLWAWTAVVAPPPGYDGDVPYGFGIVELPADGLRIVTRLTEPDPAHLSLGQAVELRTIELPNGQTTWAFAPVTRSGPGTASFLAAAPAYEVSRAQNRMVR